MLRPITTGLFPIGIFDGYDADLLTIKGGEVLTLSSVLVSNPDKFAPDGDGYVTNASTFRPILTKTLSAASRALFLADDGNAGYGTLFGTLVGGIAGQQVSGTRIGPATATGSGKITAWNSPGLYSITLDAVNTAADGVVPTNASLVGGSPLTATTAGLLSPVGAAAGTFDSGRVVATFVEFSVNSNSKVSTPGRAYNEALVYWLG